MALEPELVTALEQIAAICGWEKLEFIWNPKTHEDVVAGTMKV